ncbi:hypothetical protein HON58_02660 [Candidatus Peregrinibacteria bacterium]|jgi:hypothetical protein|nr:hypothetical protein [Candidatus Peregrinibacteria bacterium]
MNFKEIKNAVKHLQETCTCSGCKNKYLQKDIKVVATTSSEGLFELVCNKCHSSTIVTVLVTREEQNQQAQVTETRTRTHRKISTDDVLDIKNFLTDFDGNFIKLFTKEK